MQRKKSQNQSIITLTLSKIFSGFFESSKAGGLILILFTGISLFIANSPLAHEYLQFWQYPLRLTIPHVHLPHTLGLWINDGLMTLFFLLVGIEIKRELLIGEISSVKTAMLPVMAAIGGMVVPALIYTLINKGHSNFAHGAGIPTATDIAFAIAILSILGNKIPNSFKVFLTALAIIDDLGAILIIALFYGGHIQWLYLLGMAATAASMVFLGKKGNRNIFLFSILGIALWFFTLQSGIHATIAGVIMAFCLPFDQGTDDSLVSKLNSSLHRPVNFGIMPLFALANTAIIINTSMASNLSSTLSLGIFAGLVLGKPIGIYTGASLSHKFGLAEINPSITKKMLLGGGFLGGIGFTMSIFVSNLAFDQYSYISIAKLSVIIASITAASIGYFILLRSSS